MVKSWVRGAQAGLALALLVAGASSESALKQEWKKVVQDLGKDALGRDLAHWQAGSAVTGQGTNEHWGQMCDTYKPDVRPDIGKGCAVVFLADPEDANTVKNLPADQQNNFQNTQHYHAAWNFPEEGGSSLVHGGFKGDSLPIAGKDIDPVCYMVKIPDANGEGQLALGYEEGEGDVLLPCPGARRAMPYTQEELNDALMHPEKLPELCEACYQAVCTGRGRTNPENCGERGSFSGGKQVGQANNANDLALIEKQVTPAYHCHLAINDASTCDYVQFDQHEGSRDYYMDYGVFCGWQNVKQLKVSYCDCTLEAPNANGCAQQECLDMAIAGVACGNCGGCDKNRAYDGIFSPREEINWQDLDFSGHCAAVDKLPEGTEKETARMLCSKGIFCREYKGNQNNCQWHCEHFGDDSDALVKDSECPGVANNRRLLESTTKIHRVNKEGTEAPIELVAGYTEISKDYILGNVAPIRPSGPKR